MLTKRNSRDKKCKSNPNKKTYADPDFYVLSYRDDSWRIHTNEINIILIIGKLNVY